MAVTLAQWFATCQLKHPSTKVSRQTSCATLHQQNRNEMIRNTSKYIEPFSLATRKQHPRLQSWLCELLQPQHFHVSKSVAIWQYHKQSKLHAIYSIIYIHIYIIIYIPLYHYIKLYTYHYIISISIPIYCHAFSSFYDKNALLMPEVRDLNLVVPRSSFCHFWNRLNCLFCAVPFL